MYLESVTRSVPGVSHYIQKVWHVHRVQILVKLTDSWYHNATQNGIHCGTVLHVENKSLYGVGSRRLVAAGNVGTVTDSNLSNFFRWVSYRSSPDSVPFL